MTANLIDLHVHTTASDGTMTPEEMVFHAARAGLRAVAVTDHDTVGGVNEALLAGNEAGLEVVPGVEIGVEHTGEMHILGYFIDPNHQGLLDTLATLREYRNRRNPRMIGKLRQLGFDISLAEVVEEANGSVVGRPHIASVLKKKGYVRDLNEAFDKYLGAGKPAYVKKDRLTPREGIEIILEAGGIPVLAHPKYLPEYAEGKLDALVRDLVRCGLAGMEVYYTTHTPEDTKRLYNLARKYGLLITGGSDFHGKNKPEIKIGQGEGGLRIPYELLRKLKEALPQVMA